MIAKVPKIRALIQVGDKFFAIDGADSVEIGQDWNIERNPIEDTAMFENGSIVVTIHSRNVHMFLSEEDAERQLASAALLDSGEEE